jgi:uncharacterized phosphosugar-binding protein
MLGRRFYNESAAILGRIATEQMPNIERAAAMAAESVSAGGMLHIFGSGHSHLIAEEIFRRAGGLCCVNAILDPALGGHLRTSTTLERLEGYVPIVFGPYDLRQGEVIVIISNSGINAAPIEAAFVAKERGLRVVAITSMAHSQSVASRHSTGRKLPDLADVVIDNCGVPGDALLQVDGVPSRICATSTLTGTLIIQCLMAEIVEALRARGVTPPILISANVPRDGGGGDLCRDYEHRVMFQR